MDRPLSYSAVVAAGGTATITIRVPNGITTWVVTQISPEISPQAGAPSGATAACRLNGSLVTLFIPTGDAIAGEPPISLDPADTLTLEWAGCTPGSIAKATVWRTEVAG